MWLVSGRSHRSMVGRRGQAIGKPINMYPTSSYKRFPTQFYTKFYTTVSDKQSSEYKYTSWKFKKPIVLKTKWGSRLTVDWPLSRLLLFPCIPQRDILWSDHPQFRNRYSMQHLKSRYSWMYYLMLNNVSKTYNKIIFLVYLIFELSK